jgi:hypothetical protein
MAKYSLEMNTLTLEMTIPSTIARDKLVPAKKEGT